MRRLGVGNNTSTDRPLRAQLVVALVALLILIAVPLYLLRRPSGTENATPASASSSASLLASMIAQQSRLEAGVHDDRVVLGPAQKVRCGDNPNGKGEEGPLCDELPFFEEALAKAIRNNVACAPKVDGTGSINYVLRIDFAKKTVNIFPGQSGTWRGPQAKKAVQCVKRSLPVVDWSSVQHRYQFYMIAIMANYTAADAVGAPGASTLFE